LKIYELRYRQFARGRRSTKTTIVVSDSVENVKRRFEENRQMAIRHKLPPHRHVQLISVFAKEA
jgi:hypothetical protein